MRVEINIYVPETGCRRFILVSGGHVTRALFTETKYVVVGYDAEVGNR